MASQINVQCGPCGYEDKTKNANKWCTNCEEGFCGECEKSHKSMKVSRDHKLISVEDYREIEDITVNMNCEIHGKKLDLFCKKHDIAICVVCVPSQHKTCSSSDVISIDEASKNAKQSTALSDLEETISKTLDDVKYSINNRETALKNVDKEEQTIRKTIEDTRMSLNKCLDELERKMLLDLKSKHENCKSKYIKFLHQMKQIEQELDNMREQTLKMKRFASDLQVFLGTRELKKRTTEQIGSLTEDIKDHKNNRMEIEIHHVLGSLVDEVKQFGDIKVIETKAGLELKDANIDQAQIRIHGPMQNVRNISLQLKQKFDIKGSESITGCIILPDDTVIIADYFGSGKLLEYNYSGNHIRNILVSDKPYDLTAVDNDSIVVTYPSKKYLEIINTNNHSKSKKIQCSFNSWGISFQDEKLYVVVYKKGIEVMDLNGRTLHTIVTDFSLGVYSITTTRDRVYYTDQGSNTVHCCSTTGQDMWIFKDQSNSRPIGISVDNNQNVFAVGEYSNNLSLIQHDGKDRKVLLTDCDGLKKPGAVYYNKEKQIVCIGYKAGSIAIYQVS